LDTISDSPVARSFALSTVRLLNATNSSVEVNPNNVRCDPGVSGGIPQPGILAVVKTWLGGRTASLHCNVTTGGATTAHTKNFAVASAQATLGSLNVNLEVTPQNDAATASDATTAPGDSVFSYSAS
jgi:hypothetical protein